MTSSRSLLVAGLLVLGIVASLAGSGCGAAVGSNDDDTSDALSTNAYPELVVLSFTQNHQNKSCTGTLVAPSVVITAEHCIAGASHWQVRAPLANNQNVMASNAALYDASSNMKAQHDIGLVFLDQKISIKSYPTLITQPVANNAKLIELGRMHQGKMQAFSFASSVIQVHLGTSSGMPFNLLTTSMQQNGDSGGPAMLPTQNAHVIAAINSHDQDKTEIYSRADLVSSWVSDQIDAHGGTGTPVTTPDPVDAGTPPVTTPDPVDAGTPPVAPPAPVDAGTPVTPPAPVDAGTPSGGSGSGSGGGAAASCGTNLMTTSTDFANPVALSGTACAQLAADAVNWFSWTATAGTFDVQVSAAFGANVLVYHHQTDGWFRVANTSMTEVKATATSGDTYAVAVTANASGTSGVYALTLGN